MLNQVKQKLQKAVDHLKAELTQFRTGRATPALVEDLVISVYGGSQQLTLKELAAISAPESSQLTISPWDKSIISEIASGISAANIGLTPIVDGEIIRIQIPPLTEERRKEFLRQLNQKLELYRVEIRQIRHEFLEKIRLQKNSAEIGEDEEKRLEKQLQEAVDDFNQQIDTIGKQKEAEIMQV